MNSIALRLYDAFEVVNECRVDNADTFWTGAFCPDAISRPVQIPCFDIAASPGNRINGYARFTRDGRGVAALLRFGRQVLSPLFLIQQRMHALVFEDGSHTLEGTLSERICQVINECSLSISPRLPRASTGPSQSWGSGGHRHWRVWVVGRQEFLPETGAERAVVEGAADLEHQI